MRSYLAVITVLALTPLHSAELPTFKPGQWLSTKPKAVAAPRLVFVFARDCGNCRRSHPFVNAVHARFGEKLQVIGVHTPEFAWEKDSIKLSQYLKSAGVTYPIYQDNNSEIWNALQNRYWPAYYLFDSHGNLRAVHIGEAHRGDALAARIEADIAAVLEK